MNELLQIISGRLSERVPGLKYVAEDWGQVDSYDDPPVEFPCALIDVQDIEFSDDGSLRQRGVASVVVRVFVMSLSEDSRGDLDGQQSAASEGWEICRLVNLSLHGQRFLPSGFGAPVRRKTEHVERKDGIFERSITYAVGFVDDSCLRDRLSTRAGTIEIEVSPEA